VNTKEKNIGMSATPVKSKTTETLINAVHRISNSPDLDEVMETIFGSLKELLDYSAAVICMVDSSDGVLYRLKTRGSCWTRAGFRSASSLIRSTQSSPLIWSAATYSSSTPTG
jgi:transcriptional regulator with GAF, ATPase, and Fis domain